MNGIKGSVHSDSFEKSCEQCIVLTAFFFILILCTGLYNIEVVYQRCCAGVLVRWGNITIQAQRYD